VSELDLDGAEGEIDVLTGDSSATESGENPDFLLLNSKAALNKLAETTMTAATLDKAAPAADLAKPAAVSAAVETLTRLADAQSPAARAFVVQTGVPVTVGTPQWSQAVGDKVLWLAAQNVSSAEIRLDPPELGPMQVRVSVNQDQASVTFTSPHPAVREALDQQLNRLREMFSEQGLNLVNVDVSDKSFAQHEREKEESTKNSGNAGLDEEELAPVAITQAVSMRLVDHYA
jgi:flagellar hook-length control protein FliK